jgi:hypothetical protein
MTRYSLDVLMDVIGWIGSIEILVAYGLNSYQKLRSDSMTFYFLNLTGGLCFILYSYYKGAFASTFINIVWVIIAAVGIGKVLLKRT